MYQSKPYTRLARNQETIEEGLTSVPFDTSLQSSPSVYIPYRRPASTSNDDSTRSIPLPETLFQPLPLTSPLPERSDPTESSSFIPRGASPHLFEEESVWQNSTRFQTNTSTTTIMTRGQGRAQISDEGQSAVPAQYPPSSEVSSKYIRGARHIREPWEPGYGRRFPWMGAAALMMVVILTGASAAIALVSEGSARRQWKFGLGPQVYISILEGAAVISTFSALGSGVVCAFWQQLLRGSTIGAAHDLYESSFVIPALHNLLFRFKFNRVAIACVFATISSFSSGPLFQSAIGMSPHDDRMGAEVYRVSTGHVVAGIVISLASVSAILPLYYRYWELGRNFSLNPLEVGRAFGAPLFDGLDGNVTSQDIDFERGGVMVRYGALERYGYEKVLRIEETKGVAIRTPCRGEIFG